MRILGRNFASVNSILNDRKRVSLSGYSCYYKEKIYKRKKAVIDSYAKDGGPGAV